MDVGLLVIIINNPAGIDRRISENMSRSILLQELLPSFPCLWLITLSTYQRTLNFKRPSILKQIYRIPDSR